MLSTSLPCDAVRVDPRRREHPLPEHLAAGVGILPCQSCRELDPTCSRLYVACVQSADSIELSLQRSGCQCGQERHPVLVALPAPDDDLIRCEVDVLHGTHLAGVSLAVEQDVPADPADVCALSPQAVVTQTERLANLVEQPRTNRRQRRRPLSGRGDQRRAAGGAGQPSVERCERHEARTIEDTRLGRQEEIATRIYSPAESVSVWRNQLVESSERRAL